MKKMQWILTVAAVLFISNLCHANTLLYIAEPKTDVQQAETRICFYDTDGNLKKESDVKGIFPKLSRAGNYAAFVRPLEKYEEHYELCVSDQEGKTQQILVFMGDMRNMPVVYAWSPKGGRLAVSQVREKISGNRKKRGMQSRVLIFDFAQAKVTQVYDRLIQTRQETFPFALQWFPDNLHLLLSGQNETLIINTAENTSQDPDTDFLQAFVTDDGRKIIGLSSPEKWMFEISQYDVQTQKKEKLHTLQFYAPDSAQWEPRIFARYALLSPDGKYLLLRNPAGRSPAYILADIPAKKNLPLDMKEKNPIFQQFSPTDSRLISLMYVGGEGSYGGYGIFNTEKNEMKLIREMNAEIFRAGMAGFFLLHMSAADWIQTDAEEEKIGIDSKLKWEVPPDRTKREHPPSSARMIWKFKTQAWVNATPALDEKAVYFTGTDTYCHALDRVSGSEKWQYNTGQEMTSAPLADKGTVYLCAKNSLCALNAETGTEKWIFKPDGNARIYSAPVIKDSTVYCISGDVLYAVNADSGKEISRFKAEKQIRTSPVFADTAAYFSAGDFLYAIDSKNAKEIWKKKIPGIRVTPLVEKDMLYFGSGERDFSAFDRKTGEEKWKFAADGSVYSVPCFAHGTVFFGSDDGNFYALNADNGKEKWRFEDSAGIEIRSSSLVIGDTVYFCSGDRYVYGLDAKDGKEKWDFHAKSTIMTPLVHADGILYFGAGSSMYAVAVK